MAAGNMAYINISTGYNTTDGYYIKGMLEFRYNSKYNLTKNSVRVYYTTTPGQGNADYIDLVPPDSTETGEHIQKAEVWQKPYNGIGQTMASKISQLFFDLDCSNYIVSFKIGNLSANTTYYTTAWLRLFNSKGTLRKTLRDPIDENTTYNVKTLAAPPSSSDDTSQTRPLFRVATYKPVPGVNNKYTVHYEEDFTQCIKLGTYDVNSEDVNEDWEDADYKTHRIVARKKVTGKFEMIFPSMERQKEFFYLLNRSRELNGEGNAYVELELLLNNVLDIDGNDTTDVDLNTTQCLNYRGKFFIKIDNNAWVQPIYGHYDKYSPLSITIQEM